jgi:hypothetical protein
LSAAPAPAGCATPQAPPHLVGARSATATSPPQGGGGGALVGACPQGALPPRQRSLGGGAACPLFRSWGGGRGMSQPGGQIASTIFPIFLNSIHGVRIFHVSSSVCVRVVLSLLFVWGPPPAHCAAGPSGARVASCPEWLAHVPPWGGRGGGPAGATALVGGGRGAPPHACACPLRGRCWNKRRAPSPPPRIMPPQGGGGGTSAGLRVHHRGGLGGVVLVRSYSESPLAPRAWGLLVLQACLKTKHLSLYFCNGQTGI